MSNSMNPIKALAQRFVSLPPLLRMKLTKKLLELYGSNESSEKSFLEQFWDEVEDAHGDHLRTVNPFREESRSKKARLLKTSTESDEQGGYFTGHINHRSYAVEV